MADGGGARRGRARPRGARRTAKLKVRQPLREAVVVAADREREAIERFDELVLDELNVKAVRYVSEADELGRFELKPNYRALGPRFGKHMPQVADAVAALDADRAAETLREGGEVHVAVDGNEHPLGADDVQLVLQPLEGYQVERAGHARRGARTSSSTTSCAARAWRARSSTPSRTRARRPAWTSRTGSRSWSGATSRLAAVRAHEAYVTGETLATSLELEAAPELRDRGAASSASA